MIELYLTSGLMMMLAVYCIAMKPNLIKKIIGLAIFTDAIHLLLITIGFRGNGIPPIMTHENVNTFAQLSVDPVPQALVLTSIVISISITALALGISIIAYRHFNTLNTEEMNRLKG
ncbi:MAG: NADH-quinone oxidoreductase subunit K [Candidatus Aenigmarchaeota archaeon]|nr:NADH-quinone oxidoreductase subunit K [Candidatus Aenigmarchaeota archaeon]